jgi:hypothetical protein
MNKQTEILKSLLFIAVLKGTAILMAFLMFSYGSVIESKFLEKKASEEIEKEAGEKELRQASKLFETEGGNPNLDDVFFNPLFFHTYQKFSFKENLLSNSCKLLVFNILLYNQLHSSPFYILYQSLII